MSPDVEERFWSKVDKAGDCWLWTAACNSEDYGHFWFDRRQHQAHRVAYELLVGPIPDGLQIDHLCRTPRCVNPAHLEPVTSRENTLRGRSPFALKAAQTHCKRGHEFTPENTEVPNRGKRGCKACRYAWNRAYYARRKAA